MKTEDKFLLSSGLSFLVPKSEQRFFTYEQYPISSSETMSIGEIWIPFNSVASTGVTLAMLIPPIHVLFIKCT